MALVQCKECEQSVSTEAVACPHCGAPQRPSPPPPIPPKIPERRDHEEDVYSDGGILITTKRVVIGASTYPLRHITAVRMVSIHPRVIPPFLMLAGGLTLALMIFLFNDPEKKAPFPPYLMPAGLIVGGLAWMFSLRTRYALVLSTASGEVHALTSRDYAYIAVVVKCINDALVQQR